jgi:hypothetical protein
MSADVSAREPWEEEVLAGHRWGRHGEKAVTEHFRLRQLWAAAQPMNNDTRRIMDQIAALEICNWKLVESIVALCDAIGEGRPAKMNIGHHASITEDRWRLVSQYYAALRGWLARDRTGSYATLVKRFDPSEEIQKHVSDMLEEPDELKELYVERFCLCLERWQKGWLSPQSLLLCGHRAAATALEDEIRKRDPDDRILNAMAGDGDGRLQPCSHKALRRYDIIISSIGCGKWRGAMPARGTDGFERADVVARYLDPVCAWIEKGQEAHVASQPGRTIIPLLGEPDGMKRFLASLLVSLLRAQETSARARAEGRILCQQKGV